MNNRPLPTNSPPPARVDRLAGGRRWMLVLAAALFALALLVVLMNIDWVGAPDSRGGLAREIERFDVPPRQDPTSSGIDAATPRDMDVAFRRGAVVQVQEAGRLVQEYVADRIEPTGQGRLNLLRPRARMYFDNEDIMLIEGDNATARRRSDGLLESGTITGSVVIRLFPNQDGQPPDLERDAPRLVVHTDHADLDHIRGEVRCRDWVDVQTTEVHFQGRGLTALYSKDDGLQRLVIDQSTAPIRIARPLRQDDDRSREHTRPEIPSGDRALPNTDDIVEERLGPAPAAGDALSNRTGRTERGDRSPAGGEAPQRDRPRPAAARDTPMRQTPPARGAAQDRTSASDEVDEDWLERRRREARQRRQAPPTSVGRPTFYRAIFAENVRIWRDGASEVITGDELHLVFSLANPDLRNQQGSDRAGAVPALDQRTSAHAPMRLPRPVIPHDRHVGGGLLAMTAAARLGAWQDDSVRLLAHRIIPEPGEGDVYIDYNGRLVVSPITDEIEHLASTDDIAVRVIGTPVTIDDSAKSVHITCSTAEYVTGEERIALLASPLHPLTVRSPEIAAKGERFDYNLNEERGAFIGGGAMLVGRQHKEAAQPPDQGAARRPAASIDIVWTSGVELIFAPEPEDTRPPEPGEQRRSRLESATFRGDVVVTEDRLHMESNVLTVAFDTAAASDDAIERITADGHVVVRELGARGGYMEAEHLRIDFVPNDAGEHLPRELYLRDRALVRDPQQSIRAGELHAFFVEAARGPDATAPTDDAGTFDRMQIERFTASTDVIVELASGATATGDRLEGNAIDGTALLSGREVVIRGSENDVDFHTTGTTARMDRIDDGRSRVLIDGPGRASLANAGRLQGEPVPAPPLQEDQPPADDVPDEEPADADPATVDVTWTEEFIYIEGLEQGSGTVEFRGDVVATSTSAREENLLEALRLQIDFGEEVVATTVDSRGAVHRETRRVMRNLIARGNAKLENRTWETAERADRPRLIHMTGQHVEYNQQTMEAKVFGAGELLVNDPRDAPSEARRGELTGRGATVFNWTRDMEMKQFVDERYDVRMRGGVEMLHQSARGREHNAFLTAEDVRVALLRRDAKRREAGLDFGGSSEIQRIEARGDAGNPLFNLNAQQKRIVGHELFYDIVSNIARISGTERTPAEVRTDRQVVPVRASRLLWNLTDDTVTIDQLRAPIPN